MQDTPFQSLTRGRLGAGAAGIPLFIMSIFTILKSHGYVATPEEIQAWIDIAVLVLGFVTAALLLYSKYRSMQRHKGD